MPDQPVPSQVLGLGLLPDASFRLSDKLGHQFRFDASGRLTDMFFSPSPEHHLHVEYADGFTREFVQPPYRAEPGDFERVPLLNVMIPRASGSSISCTGAASC